MIVENPFAVFRAECEESLRKALKKQFPKTEIADVALEKPPNPDFGQLASSLCFELSKQVGQKPLALAEKLAGAASRPKSSLIEQVASAGGGYINFHVDFAKFSTLTVESTRKLDTEYGFVKTGDPLKIIVEHTSANPLHPIHIGQARNPRGAPGA